MTALDVTVAAPDGTCPVSLHLPDGDGPWPGVIMYPDAAGARPTFRAMADRMAGLGYATLLPDVYYREGDWKPFDVHTVFGDPDERARLMSLGRSLTPAMVIADAGAFLEFLAGRSEVAGERVGTTGYCMGGRISLLVAGHHPDRIGAAASFHGGRLADESDPDSPALVADQVQATVYVAAAENDATCPPEQLDRLDKAYTEAGVTHTIETYPGAHGFAVPDNIGPYDEALGERHWAALETLYGSTLRP
jgi:carboxymethylenebutenolidase